MRAALAPQDFLYTLLTRQEQGVDARIIGCLLDCIHVGDQAQAERLLAAMADPAVTVVTMTITEKGYCHDPATGDLDTAAAAISRDLASPASPRSAIGLLVEALRRRRAAGIAAFTTVPCDNLPANGRLCARVAGQYAQLVDADLARFIAGEARFLCTMVDRIVPRTTADDRAQAERLTGLQDAWPVAAEGFSQWVIEDDFAGPRPAWERSGAQLVADVEPYERMKLLLLNGSHFSLAFIGGLLGHETVLACTGDRRLMGFIEAMLEDESAAALARTTRGQADAYIASTLARYANPGIVHQLRQIRTDGSRKIGLRILDPLRDLLAAGRPCSRLELTVAAWLCYWHASGEPLAAQVDPLQERLLRLRNGHQGGWPDFCRAAVVESGLFGELAQDQALLGRLQAAGAALLDDPLAALAGG